jgi:hypothetical protein
MTTAERLNLVAATDSTFRRQDANWVGKCLRCKKTACACPPELQRTMQSVVEPGDDSKRRVGDKRLRNRDRG